MGTEKFARRVALPIFFAVAFSLGTMFALGQKSPNRDRGDREDVVLPPIVISATSVLPRVKAPEPLLVLQDESASPDTKSSLPGEESSSPPREDDQT